MHDFTAFAAQVWRAVSPIAALSPGQRPGGNDVALIKVSRSEMSCKRGQSSLLGLPSAADIMKRATCIMRGNAPWHCIRGYALRARGIFAQQKCRMYKSRPTFPQGAALGYGQQLGLQPATIIIYYLWRAFGNTLLLFAMCYSSLCPYSEPSLRRSVPQWVEARRFSRRITSWAFLA